MVAEGVPKIGAYQSIPILGLTGEAVRTDATARIGEKVREHKG
jgi:hypothetical protein